MNEETKSCPHCGAQLPVGASFCPHCAQSIQERKEVSPPRHMPRRALYSALMVLLAAVLVLALTVWVQSRPKTYESDTGELNYGGYRLLLTQGREVEPVPLASFHAMVDRGYRNPSPLYAVSPEDGAVMADAFLEEMASVTAEVRSSDIALNVTCTEPQIRSEYYPDAAFMSIVDISLKGPGNCAAELLYTITMKNGDVIRMRQTLTFESITIYTYTAQDAPMNTIEELRALLERACEESGEYDQIHIHLPAVTYAGGLEIEERLVRLYGSVGHDGQRTTFTDTTRISSPKGVLEFQDIAFSGSGQGIGVLVSGTTRLQLVNCRVSGWETGLQAVDSAWIDADGTIFADNQVGLCFDSADTPMVSDNFYTGNTFQNNGTAVLLAHVGSDTPLNFPGTRFSGNGTDIDNRCGHEVSIAAAIFE